MLSFQTHQHSVYFFFKCGQFIKSIEFVTVLLLFYVLFFWSWGLCDLSSLTWDQIHIPCVERSLNCWATSEVPLHSLSFRGAHPALSVDFISLCRWLPVVCALVGMRSSSWSMGASGVMSAAGFSQVSCVRTRVFRIIPPALTFCREGMLDFCQMFFCVS